MDFKQLISQPEYIALIVSVFAVAINVYISWRNRKQDFAKQEYFKLQQTAEKIISKLLFIESHREKLTIFFQKSFEAEQKNKIYLDLNNTFNKEDFDKESLEIATLIEIYFNDTGKQWNFCMDCMSTMFTITLQLKIKIENGWQINWESESQTFNDASLKLGKNPQEISDSIRAELKNHKKYILNPYQELITRLKNIFI